MVKKLLVVSLLFAMLGAVAYSLREKILAAPARLLIRQDELKKADAIVLLSGSGFDRGNEAARLFQAGYAPIIICPGGNEALEFEMLNMRMKESELAQLNLKRLGVPDSAVVVVPHGTSTAEEAKFLFPMLKEKNYRTVILLTSLFHTRRAGNVFRKEFKGNNIEFVVRGAKNSRFDEYRWWETEQGMIAMNNEVVKLIYYIFK